MAVADDNELVTAECDADGILRLTLNAPASRNALSEAMMGALAAALDDAAHDAAVRVIVIAANGPVFCAGHNLKEMTAARRDPANAGDRGRAYFTKVMKQCSALMASIPAHPRPVIAEVAGTATAAGASLLQAAISLLPPTRRISRPRGSISACSVRPRWWRCRARWPRNTPWRCC